MKDNLLSVEGLHVTINGREIINDLHFAVRSGEICALLGHNGAGKTVTLKTIMGIQSKSDGAVTLNGYDSETERADYKRQFAYIPEEALLFQELTARQHFQLYALSYGLPEDVFEQRVAHYADLFELTEKLDEFPSELSKGMRQKVNIISCLIVDTPLLIVDEPFIGLDVQAATRLEDELRRRAAAGNAVLMTSHVLERVKQLCHSFVLLKNGEVYKQGAVAELQEDEVVKR